MNETIGTRKTNRETAELINISSSTINGYKKAIKITSNRKPVSKTTEEKQVSIIKSMKTKATTKLIKEEMEKIKSLFADQQLSKIEKFKTKYNISSERLNIQAGSKHTKGQTRKRNILQSWMNIKVKDEKKKYMNNKVKEKMRIYMNKER